MHLAARLRIGAIQTCFFAAIFIAGCARLPKTSDINDSPKNYWSGRISLQVLSEPPQSFSASFELKGQAERGELTLISPLGNVLGVMHWSPGEAILDQGNQQPQRFSSLDALTEQTTGAALPVGALFAWLQGDNASVSGWSADLTRQQEGRVSAKRTQPAPSAELRVVLDR